MHTSSTYQGIALGFAVQQAKLTESVLEASGAGKVFLLGLTTGQRRTESLFTGLSASSSTVSHYFLLLLVEPQKGASLAGIQSAVESKAQHFIPVTAMVMHITRFNNWLLEGHPFAAAVVQKATLLHDGGEVTLYPPAPVDEAALAEEQRKCYLHANTMVQEFLAGAGLFTVRQQYSYGSLYTARGSRTGA